MTHQQNYTQIFFCINPSTCCENVTQTAQTSIGLLEKDTLKNEYADKYVGYNYTGYTQDWVSVVTILQ